MEKRLKEYEAYATRVLEQDKKDIPKRFWDYHKQKISEFQHERQVHLIIMLFFAVLAIVAVLARIWLLPFFDGSVYGTLLNISSGVLALFLVLLEGAYIRHYFQLENGIQRLYRLTSQVYEKTGNSKK
ncbi:hypothetical protein FWH09_02110 [Candidatus Saccharibacteria bacterium]|nr:hypothetical protein [Candidatus Saccharibacteria bacterium]